MRKTIVIVVGILAMGLVAVVYLLQVSGEWQATTNVRIGVFEMESEAAYQHALNKPSPTPIVVLESGIQVSVLRDRYGKDYWSCYIETSEGVRGWVLCTSLTPDPA